MDMLASTDTLKSCNAAESHDTKYAKEVDKNKWEFGYYKAAKRFGEQATKVKLGTAKTLDEALRLNGMAPLCSGKS